MFRNQTPVLALGSMLLLTVMLNAIVLQTAYTSGNSTWYWALLLIVPLFFIVLYYKLNKSCQQVKRTRKIPIGRRELYWYRLLRHRPRHYFTGLPQGESVLKPRPPATGRTSKKRPVKPVIRKPVRG